MNKPIKDNWIARKNNPSTQWVLADNAALKIAFDSGYGFVFRASGKVIRRRREDWDNEFLMEKLESG